MIGIIDYGMGNLGSVSNACRFLGLRSRLIEQPRELHGCDALILPGVGAFGDCMHYLEARGYVPAVRRWIEAQKPFLGICLGLQILFEESDESPGVPGLGLFPGRVRKFELPAEYKVPQIGWNRVEQAQSGCPLFEQIPDRTYFYFVHSYYVETDATEWTAGTTTYGIRYTSALCAGHTMAVQFHPEKSQKSGLQMLLNFGQRVAGEEASACGR